MFADAREQSLHNVIARLHRVTRSGEGWTAQCPAHEDHKPSLSINVRDEKILLHCHAGCTTETVCAALGIDVRELFLDSGNGRPRMIAEYPYTDEKGAFLFQVVRFEPKGFRQRRPDGNGAGFGTWAM
jgi:hypothetical protein